MRFNIRACAVLAAAAVVGMSGAANASDGTITFNGEITAGSCTVESGGASQTVTLPPVSRLSLATAGATNGDTPFKIDLANCGNAEVVGIYFLPGSNVDATNDVIINTGTATQVGIQLVNSSGGVIAVGKASGSQNQPTQTTLAAGTTTFNFYARYKALGASTAGTVTGLAHFALVYP